MRDVTLASKRLWGMILVLPLVAGAAGGAPALREMQWDTKAQGNFVMAAATDAKSGLWVGTEDKGLWYFNRESGTWTHFDSKAGMGDDSIYAVAIDGLGRVWAGHLNHGVSVYNGRKWKNLNAPNGPLGHRVFRIAVCPTDGDVWIATEVGLARYSTKNDHWTYITRADGLPSDQASSIAFDQQGNVYVGLQCEGIATASAGDQYSTWQVVRGPDLLPIQAEGEGLPSSVINDVLVARDGTVYAATTAGLARSRDGGKTWTFWRGAEWWDKACASRGGPARGPPPAGRARDNGRRRLRDHARGGRGGTDLDRLPHEGISRAGPPDNAAGRQQRRRARDARAIHDGDPAGRGRLPDRWDVQPGAVRRGNGIRNGSFDAAGHGTGRPACHANHA